MKREIKFRGRHKIVGTWYCGFFYKQDNDYIITTNGYTRFVVEKDSISQFTGLLDKNGKEIFEGDIVEWKYLLTWHKNEVRWVGGGFVVTTSGFKDDLNEPQDLSLVSILNCEIIGNIYSNPELLK